MLTGRPIIVHMMRGWEDAEQEPPESASPLGPPATNEPGDPDEPNSTNEERQLGYLASTMIGLAAGLAGGMVGGGLFAVLVMIGEQFDGNYDEPSLIEMLTFAPGYFLLGAIFGSPFGLIGGLILGLIAPSRISLKRAQYIGMIVGGLIGAGIGATLQGVSFSGGWEEFFWGFLLMLMGAFGGTVGGRVWGSVFQRMGIRRANRRRKS